MLGATEALSHRTARRTVPVDGSDESSLRFFCFGSFIPVNPITIMSIHAIDPQTIAQLQAQRRNATILSICLALSCIALLAGILAYFLLPPMLRDAETIVIYHGLHKTDQTETPQVTHRSHVSKKPTAPAAAARVMIASTISQTSISVPDVDFTAPSLDFGNGAGFSDGWSDTGDGNGGGNGGGFGTSEPSSGGLEGVLYDFKKDAEGKEITYDLNNRADFVDRAVRLQKSKFSEAALSRHFQAPNRLFLTHLAIPFSDASSGPKFFEAENVIKPSGWMVHYKGRVTVPRTGSYRFSGLGDDYLVLMLNGRMRLCACWEDIQSMVAQRWDASKPTGEFASPFSGMRLVYGDWLQLRAGETLEIDLAVGERPGGKVGFVLQVEEKGVDYRKMADGRPILPLFATAPISASEQTRIKNDFGSYEFDWENVPVFSVK